MLPGSARGTDRRDSRACYRHRWTTIEFSECFLEDSSIYAPLPILCLFVVLFMPLAPSAATFGCAVSEPLAESVAHAGLTPHFRD